MQVVLLFSFFDDKDGSSAAEEEYAGDNQHTNLRACAYIFKEHTSEEGCDDLREADGAVEEPEVRTDVILEGVRKDCERQCQHCSPCASNEQEAEEEHVLVRNKERRDESESA